MAIKRNLIWKKGFTGSVQVATSYTTRATLALFLANAVNGELGVLKVSDGSIYDGTAVIPAGTEVAIITMLDGNLVQYPTFKAQDSTLSIKKQVGSAPVAQVSTVVLSFDEDIKPDMKGYSIDVLDAEERDFLFPNQLYVYSNKKSDTWRNIIDKLVALINDTTAEPNRTNGKKVTASAITYVTGTGGALSTATFTLTSVGYGGVQTAFKLAIEGFDDFSITETTAANTGVNTSVEVAEAEFDGGKFGGKTAYFEVLPPMIDQSGSPTSLVVSGTLYTSYLYTSYKQYKNNASLLEINNDQIRQLVYVPNSSALVTKLDTMLPATA